MDSIVFDSIGELGDHVAQLQLDDKVRFEGEASTDTYRDYFYGDWSIDEAVKTAQAGGDWQEGADAMPSITIAHEALRGGAVPSPELFDNVQGFAPNVPAFLAGVPNSMLDIADVVSGNKLLRVAVHVGRAQTVEQAEILNRGAAIMAVLEQLSREGYSLEVWAIWRNTANGQTVSVETCIKHGTDFWSPASVAFALGHAAFQRRLCWRTAESMTDGGNRVTGSGYGNGVSAKFDDFDLSYPFVSEGGPYETPARAVKNIKKRTIAQLDKLAKANP